MNTIKRIIPSFFTCLGILSACVAIVSPLADNSEIAGYFILIAAAFDYLDGLFARLLNSKTEFGKQLDSLADILSFGIAPTVLLFYIINIALIFKPTGATFTLDSASFPELVMLYSSFLITVFAALRLAKFNISEDQTDSFKGLPTPAVGIFIAVISITFHQTDKQFIRELILNLSFLVPTIFILSVLMVSNIKMFSLKPNNLGMKQNLVQYIFLASSVILVVLLQFVGIGLAVILYILLSIVTSFAKG